MGFSHLGVPVDIIPLFLAGIRAQNYSILLVDEFLKMNRVDDSQIKTGLEKIKRALSKLTLLYGFKPEIILCSDFMGSLEYALVLEKIKEQVKEKGLEEQLLQTVPEKYREFADLNYPLNEIACTEFLRRKGIEVKVGPSKEKVYDKIMQEIVIGISFAYVIKAYAFGTGQPAEEVVHYIPNQRGTRTGQRILLENLNIRKTEKIAFSGPIEASLYLLRLASVSGYILNRKYFSEEEINAMRIDCNKYEKKVRRLATNLFLENIVNPYLGVENG